MDDLVAFLRARFDDDERLIGEYEAYMSQRAAAAGSYVLVEPPGWCAGEPFDIDRVLREVEAKRRILDEIVPAMDGMDDRINGEWGIGPIADEDYESVELLRLLALPYSDHPDYRTEWAVAP